MLKNAVKVSSVSLIACVALAQAPRPKDGFVPDQKTAIKIAEAVLSPIYGEKQILSERPFIASLKDGVWTVGGTLPSGWEGGVAEIKIDKQSGAIISYIHYK